MKRLGGKEERESEREREREREKLSNVLHWIRIILFCKYTCFSPHLHLKISKSKCDKCVQLTKFIN